MVSYPNGKYFFEEKIAEENIWDRKKMRMEKITL
jgi:hypothetical protein